MKAQNIYQPRKIIIGTFSLLLLMFLLCSVSIVRSAIITTLNGTTANWSDKATWAGNVVPSAGDDVLIAKGANIIVDVNNATCASLTIGEKKIGILTFKQNTVLTVHGILTFGSNQGGSVIDMTLGGKLICTGLATIGANHQWMPGTGTVVLTATNTIPLAFFTIFNNLTINGGTTTASTGLTLTGNLTISVGTFLAGSFTHNLAGSFLNSGTFSASTGTINFGLT